MADTPLPSVATVNDAQLAAMLEVYGTPEGYKTAMIQHILNDIKLFKQGQIQMIYTQRLEELNTQEREAMAAVDEMLTNLVNP